MTTILLIVAVAALGAILATLTPLWLLARRRVRHLRSRVRHLESEKPQLLPRARRLVPRPDEAVKAVWETATLVREKGIGGALRTSIGELAGWAQVERPDLVELAGADGRVAILFSDIEGSTSMNDQLGDRVWVRVLGVHDRVLRREVERHEGQVVKSQGDGFMVAFADPELAVRCAVALQQSFAKGRVARASILVRVGIHYGSVVHRDNDIFGRNVALAARVAAHAEGGQILLSEAVTAAVAPLEDLLLGETVAVHLKGINGEQILTSVDWRG